MNKIIKNTLILTAITVVSGLLLGIVYNVTKSRSHRLRRIQSRKHIEQSFLMHLIRICRFRFRQRTFPALGKRLHFR